MRIGDYRFLQEEAEKKLEVEMQKRRERIEKWRNERKPLATAGEKESTDDVGEMETAKQWTLDDEADDERLGMGLGKGKFLQSGTGAGVDRGCGAGTAGGGRPPGRVHERGEQASARPDDRRQGLAPSPRIHPSSRLRMAKLGSW